MKLLVFNVRVFAISLYSHFVFQYVVCEVFVFLGGILSGE